MNQIKKNKKGFTLVDMVFYLIVVVTLILTITQMVGTLTSARLRGEAITEVDNNGIFVARTISSEIINATVITAPTKGLTDSSLVLETDDLGTDPIEFTLNSGVLTMSEAGGTPIQLTSNRVVVSDINFYNFSVGTTDNSVSFDITIRHSNPDNISELNYERTFYGSGTVRE